MKKRLLILMTVTGMIILLGGLLTYGLGVHEIIPVPRPDLIVVGTSLIGILLIVSGVCDLFVKKTKEMEIEENDERNISLSNAAMASGFKVMNVTIAVSIFCFDFHRIYDSSPMFHYYWGLCYWTNCIYCATLVLAQNYVNVLLNTRRPQRHNKQEI